MESMEYFANFQAEAKLDADQYAMLVAAMTDWCKMHQDDPEAQEGIQLLKSIEFKRVR